MSTKTVLKTPVFIVCGKSPISSYGGGYSTYALNLSRILTSLGYKVYILSVGKENTKEKTKFGTLLTFKSFLFDYHTTALPSLPFVSYVFAKHIEKFVTENQIDKFIVWGIGPWGFTGSILKKKFNHHLIFLDNYFTTIKNEWRGGLKALLSNDYGLIIKIKFLIVYYTVVQILAFFEKKVLTSADFIITNYQSTERILISEFDVNPSKMLRITFLTNIYTRKVDDKNLDKDSNLPKKYILYLSRHDPRKGINYLLHAVKILKERNKLKIPAIIAGRGEMLESNKRLAEKLNIKDSVQFLGFVNNPKPLLKNASIFCFPTVQEGAGALIINEAMSLGIPIISTKCDGIPEDIVNNQSGILVEPQNSVELANALEKLMYDEKLAKTLGENARKRFNKLYSYEKMKQDIKKIIAISLMQN